MNVAARSREWRSGELPLSTTGFLFEVTEMFWNYAMVILYNEEFPWGHVSVLFLA